MSTPAIFVVAFIVAALLDLVIPHPAGVLRAEFGTGLAGTLVGIGAGLIGLFGGKIDKNVKTALDGMRLSLRLALEALADFGGEVGGEQAKSTGIIARILGVVLLGLIHGVDNGITGLHNWLKNTLGPVLRALQKFRKLFLAFYDKWFKPIFDTIDVIRHVLQVLSFLHLDFARNLDQKLSDLEARLRKIILFPLVELNKVINQVNLVIDEFGFYQRYTLVRSMIKYDVDMWNTLLHRQVVGISPAEKTARAGQQYERNDPAVAGVALGEFYRTGGGELAPVINELAPVWLAAAGLSSAGGNGTGG